MSGHHMSFHGQSPLAGRAPLSQIPSQHYPGASLQPPAGFHRPNNSPSLRPTPAANVAAARQAALLDRQIEGDGREPSFLIPPSPTSRLLLSLLSPFRDEIAWSLSRLIHASHFYLEHLVLSEWCGLAQRLLSFVQRLNKAARGQPGWEWEEDKPAWVEDEDNSDMEDEDDDEDEDGLAGMGSSSRKRRPRFDPRSNDEHYFILNAAISASLILRNTCHNADNAQWLTRQPELLKVASETISLPEDIFGFEGKVGLGAAVLEAEEEMRLEGIREMRMYWMEILRSLAPRMRLYDRSDAVRFEDGSIDRVKPTPAPVAAPATATATDAAPPLDSALALALRPHSSDQIFTRALLLLHSTADRALLLAVLRFLAQLISNCKADPEVFVEESVSLGERQGWSPGIVSRCRELLPLCEIDHDLGEAVLDCLDASVDVAVDDKSAVDKAAASEQEPSSSEDPKRMPGRPLYANALRLFSSAALPKAQESFDTVGKQAVPTMKLLTHMLSLHINSWQRTSKLVLHPSTHPLHLIPSRYSRERDRYINDPKARAQEEVWLALRSAKAEGGMVNFITLSEKMKLKELPEPERLTTWLTLVTRTAGGPGSNPENPFYLTQMQLWTSYRDTFTPLIEASQRTQRPLPPLMAAYDVISKTTETLPETAAVLIDEEDPRIGGQKFVVRGLEGFLRPEVLKYNCQWRGCPASRTDSSEAQADHARAHVEFADDPAQCRWATCSYCLPPVRSGSRTRDETKRLMVEHIRTHLPDGNKIQGADAGAVAGDSEAKVTAPSLPVPPSGRFVPVATRKPAEAVPPKAARHPHAVSASDPSMGTFDRPSSIYFNVYRTPFDHQTMKGEGPAYLVARILIRVAEACRTVLGEADGQGSISSAALAGGAQGDEELDTEDGADDEDEDWVTREEKRVKLDFSDRSAQPRFGMPFALPENWDTAVAAAAAAATKAEAAAAAARARANQNPGNDNATGANASAIGESAVQQLTPEELSLARRRAEAKAALQALLAVEDDVVKWASGNDILSGELLLALDHLLHTKGGKVRSSTRRHRSGSKGEGAAAQASR